MGGRDGVIFHIHRPSSGGSSTVGGTTNTPGGLRLVKRPYEGRQEETPGVDTGDNSGGAKDHTVICIVVGTTNVSDWGKYIISPE